MIQDDEYDEGQLFGITPDPVPQRSRPNAQPHQVQAPPVYSPQQPEEPFPIPQSFTPPAPVDPLQKYYRVPGLHIALPTRGAFFRKQDYDPTMANEVPVYPMRTADELLMQNPDALMSGYAIEEMIRSCVPAIKNPREVSSPDLDAILLAVRAASFGDTMEMTVECPQCARENTFDCHLPTVMSHMTFVDPKNEIRLSDDVVIYVRPYTLAMATKIALTTYEEARKLQMLDEDSMTQQEISKVRNETFSRITKLNVGAICDSILGVVVPEGQITDRAQINNFINNVSRDWVAQIETKLKEINTKGVDKTMHVQCIGCEHEWEADIEYNPATFFAPSS